MRIIKTINIDSDYSERIIVQLDSDQGITVSVDGQSFRIHVSDAEALSNAIGSIDQIDGGSF